MAVSDNNMDFSIFSSLPVYRSERFRTPFGTEKDLGLWADRIGEGFDNASHHSRLRLLGLWGAVYIEKGEGSFVSKSAGDIRAAQGDIMILFPDEPHHYSPDRRWKTRFIVWGGPESALLEQSGYLSPRKPLAKDRTGYFIQAYEILQGIMDFEDIGSALLRKSTLLSLIHSMYTGSETRTDSEQATLLKEAVHAIRSTLSNPLSVPELAKICHVSEAHFRRLFKAHTGRSPSRYIASLRISEAKRLLATGRSIKETALSLGYADEYYFMRVFRKETGMTAGEFRKTV
jgi:AraC-like DNA-binding protein